MKKLIRPIQTRFRYGFEGYLLTLLLHKTPRLILQ